MSANATWPNLRVINMREWIVLAAFAVGTLRDRRVPSR